MQKYFNFIYVKSRGFVFSFVPKVACTNWKCLCRYMVGEANYLSAKLAHDRKLSGLTFLSDIEDPGLILEDDDIKKYCFVRNPYSRVLSAYLNKVELFAMGHSPGTRAPHFFKMFEDMNRFRLQKFPEEENVSFFVFLNWVHSSKHNQVTNPHWVPQSQILYLEEVRYDFIGRFENIDIDANYLLKLMGCDIEFPSQKDIRFNPTEASEKIQKYYSEREIELAKEIYADDFELLNYPVSYLD